MIEKMTKFKIGDLIEDGYGTKGIVVKKLKNISSANDFAKDGYPLELWLESQVDQRLKTHVHKPWLSIIPLTGGAAYAPEALCTHIRDATKEDFEIAKNRSNPIGQDELDVVYKSTLVK